MQRDRLESLQEDFQANEGEGWPAGFDPRIRIDDRRRSSNDVGDADPAIEQGRDGGDVDNDQVPITLQRLRGLSIVGDGDLAPLTDDEDVQWNPTFESLRPAIEAARRRRQAGA